MEKHIPLEKQGKNTTKYKWLINFIFLIPHVRKPTPPL